MDNLAEIPREERVTSGPSYMQGECLKEEKVNVLHTVEPVDLQEQDYFKEGKKRLLESNLENFEGERYL